MVREREKGLQLGGRESGEQRMSVNLFLIALQGREHFHSFLVGLT